MIDTVELMRKVGNIRILTSRRVDERLSGDYHSVFRGQGMEFDEVREYVPGDDVRSIDWNVTARTGFPHIKRYSEERELTVIFLVDISGSQSFGSGPRPKSELAAELTCLLALTSVRNQDKIGLILFSDAIVQCLPPRKGRTAVMRLVREVLATEDSVDSASGPRGPTSKVPQPSAVKLRSSMGRLFHRMFHTEAVVEDSKRQTDIANALRFLNGVQRRRAVVFLISDFMDTGYEKQLQVTARRHDVVCCHLSDPAEHALPNVGLVELEDSESDETQWVDTSSKAVREHFEAHSASVHAELRQLFRRSRLDPMFIQTNQEPIDEVRRLFQRRAARSRSLR